ncbi:MAG: ubiquinol oxidase subunit II [Gammaproteobacteria bacterium]|nr:ubiquinol oxidase subunit II [Gammaproteobacteria bacterium]
MIKKYLKSACLLVATLLIGGCELALFDPKGPVGEEAKWLIIISVALMLIVIIPVLMMIFYFPYKYRKSNTQAEYKPDWEHSTKIEIVVWTVPTLIIIALSYVTYETSHSLDPRKPLSDEKHMTIQVVAMDWKWLFIYPEQGIATINEISIPVNTPVEFLITSDTVMNSFFIPRLGSQIYAMAGMENRLHLMADQPGTFRGVSANYSGFGFSGMKFKVHATDQQGFDDWVAKVKSSPQLLNKETLSQLRVQSKDHKIEYFSTVGPHQFKQIIQRYTGAHDVK